jgi:hypothetical protein
MRRGTIALFLCLALISFTAMDLPAQKSAGFDCALLKEKIQTIHAFIDSVRFDDDYIDSLDVLNEKIYACLKELTLNDRFATCDVDVKGVLSYLVSADHKFAIASWDTRMGGTMIDFASAVIYKTHKLTSIKRLTEQMDGIDSDIKIFFLGL